MKRGLTISTLTVVVAIMLIISTTASVVGVRSINSANFEDYMSKVRRMSDAVLEYIDTNGEIPTTGEIILVGGLSADLKNEMQSVGDNSAKLYVVDVKKLDIVTNIGKGNVNNEDVFVVSETTNNVYYLKGREYKGTTYYGI